MSRGHIFLANGVLLPPSNSGRFCIFDMETSSLPVFQDTLDGASCQAVYIESHYAYVGFVDQFRVYDINDADEPTLEKTADFESDPINKINNVIVVDGFVYLTRRNELIIYKHVQ